MRYLILGLISVMISACTALHRPITVAHLTNDGLARIANIRHNQTLFSASLECYGANLPSLRSQVYADEAQPGKFRADQNAIIKDKANLFRQLETGRIGVSLVFDKTGKLFPATSTAISDMILNALGKVGVSGTVDVDSNANTLADIAAIAGARIQQPGSSIASLPRGVIFSPVFHISGALTELNTRESGSLSATIDFFSGAYTPTVIDVALDLRVVNSQTGELFPTNGKAVATSVANRLVTINTEFGYVRSINALDINTKLVFNIGDPQFYAVRELVEYATLELLSQVFVLPWQAVCPVDPSKMQGVFPLKQT